MATPRRATSARQRSAATPRTAQRTTAASASTVAANKAAVRRFILARGRLPTPGELGRIVKRK